MSRSAVGVRCCLLVPVLLMVQAVRADAPPLALSENLELPRFMGKWYVIANIPTLFERNAFAATEEYVWLGDGKVATTFSYRRGSFAGELKELNTTAFVSAQHDAVWKMQFVWPFKADYRVMYVDDAHSVAIVGRNKRDYVWLLARTPDMTERVYTESVRRIELAGYDISLLQRVPHPSVLQPSPGPSPSPSQVNVSQTAGY